MPAKDPVAKEKAKMLEIVEDLKKRIEELDDLKKDIDAKKIKLSASPRKSREILEEIKVPPLEILKDGIKEK